MDDHKPKILVVDDEESLREFLEIMLKREGYDIATAPDGDQAIKLLTKKSFDMVITDLQMPKIHGMQVLAKAKEIDPELVVLVITAFGSTESAVEAMKLGAYDYITKPFKIDEIKLIIKKALEKRILARENIFLKKELGAKFNFGNLVGSAQSMLKIYDLIQRVCETKTNVLITGESGTGKELVAKAIHYNGPLKDKPFVTVNCGAIPENLMESEMFGHKKGSFTGAISDKLGLFEVANNGTIFLDEIGELPLHIQVKLLRVLQDKTFRKVGGTEDITVNVRIMAATNKELGQEVSKGNFREDLYYRLNVIHIQLPPLRERKEDVSILAQHFLEKFNKQLGKDIKKISKEAMDALSQYDYPGNVRELENIIERTVSLERGAAILPESLPPVIFHPGALLSRRASHSDLSVTTDGVNLEEIVGNLEKDLIEKALKKAGGVKKKAAKLLGISFRSMRYRLEKYGME
ncbi:MAG: Fis family transcriptional regulator [Deltaproteobacteria bacterium GWA2_38_16]|nr:MAG: Fis family transcriptional regulator [Deltaproteobacteria bacterium GWA2_38_16]OGQ02382.1 MAG: Fis family transcriptional regulator [Deltaproteobacteria bacterium RIFCSPHIGHO2_02_FULL_38_15]OGQ33044.1 MAG: Fis family transcriptional regulator [Deltaproteobacteria bacterium RIFCSPLOWO2_01_FULL_38_9]OGQ62344.1 MAG: Fis family transcriptional regulator [Deltaproteobacteria bacterium RIFCSPLOWO2_12_FULL_38_8]HBQ20717.1 Fis family transcriptional regulator [Deltaproteobacteria bacterium]